jgi:hypothetical protein
MYRGRASPPRRINKAIKAAEVNTLQKKERKKANVKLNPKTEPIQKG